MLLHCTWMGPPSCIRLRLRKTVLLLLLCYQPWWQRWRRQRARQQRRERRLRRWRIDRRLRRRLAARVATFRAASAQSSFHEEKVGEGMFALCTAASGRTCVPMVIPSVGTWVPSVRGVARRVSATRRSRESGGGGPALSSVGGDRDVEATWRAGEPVAGRPRHPHQPPPRPRPAAPPLRPRFFFFVHLLPAALVADALSRWRPRRRRTPPRLPPSPRSRCSGAGDGPLANLSTLAIPAPHLPFLFFFVFFFVHLLPADPCRRRAPSLAAAVAAAATAAATTVVNTAAVAMPPSPPIPVCIFPPLRV